MKIAQNALSAADELRKIFRQKGWEPEFGSPTNQVFIVLPDETIKRLSEQVEFSFWEKSGKDRSLVRFATSWSTTAEDIERLKAILNAF
ncbi:hypothetical protein MUN46_007555 [Mesosutterella sp. AGMB02718]|uniref:Low specificity L-threonine aldolase n=1 Tax=Mesosutterella faecium TaxID=2925194 RepID=A0ABT7IN30_9BURK|nr:hypothetical protein [Mesosutterella sp. AGMB02718]MDL2059782.1 hypothetical protein [Mesosutterella sp. AGMB02718]